MKIHPNVPMEYVALFSAMLTFALAIYSILSRCLLARDFLRDDWLILLFGLFLLGYSVWMFFLYRQRRELNAEIRKRGG